MRRPPLHAQLALGLLLTTAAPAAAQRRGGQEAAPDLSDSTLVSSIAVRSIGPAVMSGRVEDIAVASSVGSRGGELGTVFYVAAASGGVWKTVNGGMSWRPVFDEAGVGSIGAVAVAPSNSEIVWVGTGEDNNQRSSSFGDGVYRSMDGGLTFRNMGLHGTQHIGKIRVHPTEPNTVFVAAVGPLWAAGGERGVYKTSDGGASWRNVLSVDEHTGAADIVLDPSDPDVIYVSTLQRERRAYSYVGGGPGSGIWKSTDGGESWTRLRDGLPTSGMGRIGLDVSRSHPTTVYAVVEGSDGGVYRSDDAGASWRKMSDIASIPWYFGEIRVDPSDPERVYHLGVQLQVSTDGGATWTRTGSGPHSDQHALWISPENPNLLILGNDGGVYVSRDRGASWDFSPNLPISQFYAVGLDNAEPFFGIAGGLQDNSTWGGPSRTRSAGGIFNSDWYRMAGGDGFYAAIDPIDPDIAYVESQNGNILRFDRRTGDRKAIRPQPAEGEPSYRFNWSAPIKISPWDHATVYFAANLVFKSTDRGDSWTRLGEDLTRAIDRDSLPMMGAIPDRSAVSRHQGTADFSNISDLDISTLERGLLMTGSDDGTLAISRDDGATWTKQTRFPGVPDTAYVSKVRLSRHDASVMYATFDNHRSNDFRPYVIRSSDGGRTWANITANLPAFGNVRAFAEHPRNPDLLFVGTEIAPFVSLDGGRSWTRIRNGLPPVRVDDLAIHERENTLVIATHGRGFYLIDDLAPLEHLAGAKAAGGPFLVPIKSALQMSTDPSPTSGTHGARDYAGDNPEVGTTISYYLPAAAPNAKLEVVASGGRVVRSLDASTGAGLHGVAWDLRAEAPYSGPPQPRQQQGGFGGFGGGSDGGPPVVPGTYTVRLRAADQTLERPVVVRPDPAVTLNAAQLAELFEFRTRQMELNATLTMAIRQSDEVRERIAQAKAALAAAGATSSLSEQAAALERDLEDVRTKLGAGGGGFFGGGGGDGPRSLRQRLGVAGGALRATAMPTEQEREALDAVPAALEAEVGRLNALVTERLPAFFRALDDAGVPWTPGRPIR